MIVSVIILGFFTSFVNTGDSNGSYVCSTESIQKGFKCVHGSECISQEKVCDRTKNCRDGSDEDLCFTRKSRQTKVCVLPPYPDHGTYDVLNDPKSSKPGQHLDSIVMRVTCQQGYGIVPTGYDAGAKSTQDLYCISGEWSGKMPECVRFCRLDKDPGVRYMCTQLQECNTYVSPGTVVVPICNTPVYYSSDSLQYMKCFFGSWNYVAKCKPDCGRITPSGVQLVIDGTPAKRGELPWHVGIYRKTKPYTQICGGSLVSNDVVISAAHCFWSDVNKLLPAANYAVAVGKLYRPWDDERDGDAQKSDVKHIAIPTLFRGIAAHFQDDIAILTLTTPFTYKTYVRPVCLNFDISFDTWHLQLGNLGKVAGWGLTGAHGEASEYLQVVDMPFVNEATCITTLPQSFTAYITSDKFCAGYTNGTALCRGDSGGGIVFADREQGLNRYYLRGVVSTAPTTTNKLCNDESYITFTKVTKHEAFIKYALANASVVQSCPVYKFQCSDGTCMGYETECVKKQEFNGFQSIPLTTKRPPKPPSPTLPKPTLASPPPAPPSILNRCVFPSYPENGSYLVNNMTKPYANFATEDSVLAVRCNEGYVLAGSSQEVSYIKCSSGQWDKALPRCVSKPPSPTPPKPTLASPPPAPPSILNRCVFPSYPENGSYLVNNMTKPYANFATEDSVLAVRCNEGYVLAGSSQEVSYIKCSSGQWDKALPRCVSRKSTCSYRSPCRDNSICSEKDDMTICTCIENFSGNPYEGCHAICRNDKDCAVYSKCIKSKCERPAWQSTKF